MDLTISSVTTTCLLCSVVILLLCGLFKSNTVMKVIGPSCMIIVLLAIIIRMFLPLEFPYTYSLYIEDVLTPFRRVLTHSIIMNPIEITVWDVLIIIWMIGIVCCFVYKLSDYRKVIRCIHLLPKEKWEILCNEYDFDMGRYEDITKMQVVYTEQFTTPCLVGIFKPYLVLPKLNWEKKQFHYIILHELMHVRNKDMVWKVLIDVLCTLFWWNPVLVYLKKELFQLIELRNDMQILALLSDEETIEYMKCLKNTAKQLANKDRAFALAFNKCDLKELTRRMTLIASDRKFCSYKQVVLGVVVCIMLFFTSAVVIEPYSHDAEEGVAMTADNTFLIINGDQYDVYIDGEYIFSTDDLRPFRDVEIYNNLEEANKNE